jgi:hypothetical protein
MRKVPTLKWGFCQGDFDLANLKFSAPRALEGTFQRSGATTLCHANADGRCTDRYIQHEHMHCTYSNSHMHCTYSNSQPIARDRHANLACEASADVVEGKSGFHTLLLRGDDYHSKWHSACQRLKPPCTLQCILCSRNSFNSTMATAPLSPPPYLGDRYRTLAEADDTTLARPYSDHAWSSCKRSACLKLPYRLDPCLLRRER